MLVAGRKQKKMWRKAAWAVFILVGLANAGVMWVWLPLITYDGTAEYNPTYRDALHRAMEIGRLDAISVMVGFIAVLLGVLALFSFGYVNYRADRAARETARETADEVARAGMRQLYDLAERVEKALELLPSAQKEGVGLRSVAPKEVEVFDVKPLDEKK